MVSATALGLGRREGLTACEVIKQNNMLCTVCVVCVCMWCVCVCGVYVSVCECVCVCVCGVYVCVVCM